MTTKKDKIEKARLKLRARHLAEGAAQSPSKEQIASRLPIGQTETVKWPVLDLGTHPSIEKSEWSLRVDGAVELPFSMNWGDLMQAPQVDDTSDFHCVTTWSKLNMRWRGISLWSVILQAKPHEQAVAAMCYGADGYTTNLSLSAIREPGVLLVHEYDGKPLSRVHGGPCRVITPQLYAWKGTKWIQRIEILTVDTPGYWEQRGYSNTADPWTDDRYGDELPEAVREELEKK